MGKLFKYLVIGVGGLVLLLLVAVVFVAVTFDPNEYRDEIIAEVEAGTGRTLQIDGDIELTLFPVLSLQFGGIQLGNAEGFDPDTPFFSLDSASASVRVLPAIFSREIRMGTVSVQSLAVNLAVNEQGTGNWEDLAEGGDTAGAEAPSEGAPGGGISGFQVGGLDIVNASVTYADAQAGTRYTLSNMRLVSGPAAIGEPLALEAGFEFDAQPDAISGQLDVEMVLTIAEELISVRDLEFSGRAEGVMPAPTVFSLSTDSIDLNPVAQTMEQTPLDVRLGSLQALLDVRPINYADGFTPQVRMRVEPFSPKSLMNELGLEPVETADPDALERVSFEAFGFFNETDEQFQLNDLRIVVDDTTFEGLAAIPLGDDGKYRLGLAGDSIDLTRYMAPAGEEAEAEAAEAAPVELPVDLIRAFDVFANFKLEQARFGNLEFSNIELEVNSAGGNARLHPIAADFYGGGYRGDIRLDASSDNVLLSVDERVEDVSVGDMLEAMYGAQRVTGTFNGSFQLAGRGADIDAIRRDLDGQMAINLSDGAYEGTDFWYQIRRARALFKREEPPAAPTNPRTEFTGVRATGTVTDGILQNNDFLAELPFMQMEGQGSVNLAAGTIDYAATARILEKPEFIDEATEAEMEEFTAATIPLKITGSLSEPSIRPDIEEMLKGSVIEKAQEKLLERLTGDEEAAEGEEAPQSVEDALKDKARDRLKDLLRRR